MYMYANQGVCVSQTALKTLVFEAQKEMFFKSQKSLKKNQFLPPC